jgi:hypothetical protein
MGWEDQIGVYSLTDIPRMLYDGFCAIHCEGPEVEIKTYRNSFRGLGRQLKESKAAIGLQEVYSTRLMQGSMIEVADNQRLIVWFRCPKPDDYGMIFEPEALLIIHARPIETWADHDRKLLPHEVEFRISGELYRDFDRGGFDLTSPNVLILTELLRAASKLASNPQCVKVVRWNDSSSKAYTA